jgi:hypothetical protein
VSYYCIRPPTSTIRTLAHNQVSEPVRAVNRSVRPGPARRVKVFERHTGNLAVLRRSRITAWWRRQAKAMRMVGIAKEPTPQAPQPQTTAQCSSDGML